MENNNAMKDILGGSGMSNDSIDMILKAINDMQDKINNGIDEKLQNYVTWPKFNDLEHELKSNTRQTKHLEGVVKDHQINIDKNAEMLENLRKRIQRLQSELDALKNTTQSQMSQYADMQHTESLGSIENDGDAVGSEDLNKLKKMI